MAKEKELVNAPETIKGTLTEIAEKMQVDYAKLYGFVKFLEGLGMARIVGKVPPARGFGKSTSIYEFPAVVQVDMLKLMSGQTKIA